MDNLGKDGDGGVLMSRVSGKKLFPMGGFALPRQKRLLLMGHHGQAPLITTAEGGNDRSVRWLEQVRESLRVMEPNGEEKPSPVEMGQFVVLLVPEALLVRLDKRAGECSVSRDDYVAKAVELALWLSENEQQAIAYKIGELISLVSRSFLPKIREVFWLAVQQFEAQSLDKAREDSHVDQQE